jgi:hypothetical protein
MREKKVAKIIFWCLMPFFFAGFVRFYLAIFNLVFGIAMAFIFGVESVRGIMIVSLVISIACSIATCFVLWKQYRKHILER